MNYVYTLLTLLAVIVAYRLVGTEIPLIEHAAGLYFAALALLMHWIVLGESS